jgi:pimeloyl-ACP methyl ester carboxylesterase
MSRFRRFLVKLAAVGVALALAGCLSLEPLQRSLLYYPQPPDATDPGALFELPIAGEHVFYRLDDVAGTQALIYFAGNGDDAAKTLPLLRQAYPHRALYALEYRGFGDSSGLPSEKALVSDALLLFDVAHEQHADILLLGRSLGSGIAVQVAAGRPATALVLITPYDSVVNVAKDQYPRLPLDWIMTDRYESWRFAPRISVPTVLLIASNDRLISRARSQALFECFRPGVATLHVIEGADHNDILASPELLLQLQSRP